MNKWQIKKRAYISGPMTGVEDYKTSFLNAEQHLCSIGYEVANPAYNDDVLPNADYEQYMALDMFLLEMCDCIYMLKGWEKSYGANREYGYAMAKRMDILFEK